MCCITHEGKSLVVTTDVLAIRCYSRDSGELVWRAEGKFPGMGKKMEPFGITADGQGHLFVADLKNQCVQKFSAGGKYLGVLVKQGEEGLGEPYCLKWNGFISPLIVAHSKDGMEHISVVHLE